MKHVCALAAIVLCGSATSGQAQAIASSTRDAVFDLSLEQLMEIPITSVSRRQTPLSRSAAAVAVITHDDIRRLGITSLPEALRLVPGLEVARINAHSWAIGARGFNGQFSDKLLVLLDGRILYEARFPGVFWDAQDVVLEDIDRIEVIRGPGATLWGANAVNGVINIITKTSAETSGALVSTAIGSDERPTTSVRYGGAFGRDVTYRVHGKVSNRTGLVDADSPTALDGWQARRGGARAEWTNHARDRLTLQSDVFSIRGHDLQARPLLTRPFTATSREAFSSDGGNVLGRWQRQLSTTSDVAVQGYYATSAYRQGGALSTDDLTDVELTHRFSPRARHDVVWGAGYRDRRGAFSTVPGEAHPFARRLQTAFVQDEITLVADRLFLTAGSKLEHHSDAGVSVDPSVRALWVAHHAHTIWGAVSRAVRTPDLFELGGRHPVSAFQRGPASPVILVSLTGQPGLVPESVVAYEMGYRTTPARTISLEVATFYNTYRDLIGFIPGEPTFTVHPITPYLALPLNATNTGGARSFGYELSAHWNPTAVWRLSPSYTYVDPPALADTTEVANAAHRVTLLSSVTLPRRVELNAAAYHVSALRGTAIPAYTRLDVGVTWQPNPCIELGVWGQNLTDARHVEYFGASTTRLEAVKRSVVAQITWRAFARP
jgi:iron complex outermembrane receptor protein